MPSSRQSIRSAVKSIVETFYVNRVETAQRFSPADADTEFALVYFTEGVAVDEGVGFFTRVEMQIAFFKSGVSSDDELDDYEDQLALAIQSDTTLRTLVRGFDFSGFLYDETEDNRFSSLVLRFSVSY